MPYLTDTNVLLRSTSPGHPMFSQAVAAVESILRGGEEIYLVPQNLMEFWAVATRPPERNGLGMTAEQALLELERLEEWLPILPEAPEVYREWRRLVVTHGVLGVGVHDTRLVAAMLIHNITHLLTFNVDDFRRYPRIVVVHPEAVL